MITFVLIVTVFTSQGSSIYKAGFEDMNKCEEMKQVVLEDNNIYFPKTLNSVVKAECVKLVK